MSGRKRPNPLSTDLTDEPAPKQTRIVEVNSDSESDYEAGDSDATTDEDAGNIYPDGIRTVSSTDDVGPSLLTYLSSVIERGIRPMPTIRHSLMPQAMPARSTGHPK